MTFPLSASSTRATQPHTVFSIGSVDIVDVLEVWKGGRVKSAELVTELVAIDRQDCFTPHMIDTGFSKIINISTTDQKMVCKGFALYGPSKSIF